MMTRAITSKLQQGLGSGGTEAAKPRLLRLSDLLRPCLLLMQIMPVTVMEAKCLPSRGVSEENNPCRTAAPKA